MAHFPFAEALYRHWTWRTKYMVNDTVGEPIAVRFGEHRAPEFSASFLEAGPSIWAAQGTKLEEKYQIKVKDYHLKSKTFDESPALVARNLTSISSVSPSSSEVRGAVSEVPPSRLSLSLSLF
jgi:hypothetical protein